ncbi:MAG: XdhC family protein [Candidatus Methylomirabilia bacterium]
MAHDLLALGSKLSQEGVPFALATVVRCERPTSAKPGAKALIKQDGTVVGWIGGSCAEPLVIKEALQALRDGQPRFIALVGAGGTSPGSRENVLEYAMPCHSGGTMEIFVEPVLPKPQLLLVGRGPVVETLAKLSPALEFTVALVSADADPERFPGVLVGDRDWRNVHITPRTFIVVATHGISDEEALDRALRSEACYVSLVASKTRAAGVLAAMRARGIAPEQLGRIKAPAGLDVGAATPQEIALSILAEIVQVFRSQKVDWNPAEARRQASGETEVRDPVCGMSVEIASASYRSERAGRNFFFCCLRCKQAFDQAPEHYLAQTGSQH